MISRSRPPEQLIIGPPQKAAEKEPAGPWSTDGADGVAGITAVGAERKLCWESGGFRFCPRSRHSSCADVAAELGGRETFALAGNQTPVSLATTVKLGRASAGLVLCATLNAATGRRRPFSSRFPRSSNLATASTARATRLLIRICPSFASAHSLEARLHTVPIAV